MLELPTFEALAFLALRHEVKLPDESEFLRTARSIWLEIKSDNVEEMRRRILDSALVRET
jgi:hypothetical protein